MLSKHAVIFDPYNVVGVVWVIFFQVKQNLKLNTGLVLELLFVTNDFDRYNLPSFVINAL